jgi:glycosyltransferase involved in cell wall biosynthesis
LEGGFFRTSNFGFRISDFLSSMPFALKLIAADRLHHHPLVRAWLARWYAWKGRRMPGAKPHENVLAISCLCRAARLAATDAQLTIIERTINERVTRLRGQPMDWTNFDAHATQRRLEKAVLLKPRVSERERGVLYISFEYQWLRLLSLPNLAEFAREYTLVLAPSWSPPHSLINCLFPVYYPEPVFCQISHQRDLEYFPRLSPRYRMVPLLASNWVNPDWFQPRAFAGKDIDILMVANFGSFKRHHVLFRALRQLPASLRVVLIGQHEGPRTAAHLRAEAAAFGVEGRFQLLESQPHEKVCDALTRAKISLVLSLREGSCVVVAESLFANTPVGMFAEAHVGSRQFINERTGRWLQPHDLSAQLLDFLASAHKFQPRQWALDNQISCHGSSASLNRLLREGALAEDQEWTQDCAPLQWHPNPQLIDPSGRQRLPSGVVRLRERYGLEIGPE